MSATKDGRKLSNFLTNCFLRGFREYLFSLVTYLGFKSV